MSFLNEGIIIDKLEKVEKQNKKIMQQNAMIYGVLRGRLIAEGVEEATIKKLEQDLEEEFGNIWED